MQADEYIRWKSWDRRPFAAPDGWYRAFYRAELAKTGISSFRDVLEIGFGNGEFLAYARDRGILAAGVETNDALLDNARRDGFDAYESLSGVPSERRFDLVVAFDVLEHMTLDAIVEVMTDLRRRLRPGGVFLARFPNGDSPFSRASQHGDVTHQTTIGSEKLRYLAQTTGFEVTYCGATSLPVLGAPLHKAAYAVVARPLRWVIDKFLAVLYLQRTDVRFTANLTAVLRKPVAG
jgi:SAM-dependent methyltransferase